MKKPIVLLSIIICFIGCTKKTESYFNGKIYPTVLSSIPTDTLSGELIKLDGVYTGYMTVYDSLLSFTSGSFPEHFVYMFNTNNKELIGKFAPKGNGPEDYFNFVHIEQFVTDDGDIKLWGRDATRSSEIQLINLTKSIEASKFVIDSIQNLDWMKHSFIPFGFVFILNNGSMLARTQAEKVKIEGDDYYYLPDKYSLFDAQSSFLKDITIYNKHIDKKEEKFPNTNFLYSRDSLKPDGTKLVMAMEMLAQINIYDIAQDTLAGYRITGTPDFEYLKKDSDKYRCFFRDVCVDDEYIYALYSDVEINYGKNYPFESNTVLIYNWDGEIIKRVVLDKKTYEIAIDPTSDYLYVLTTDQLVYRYDVG